MEDGERKIQGYLECDGSIVRISSLEDIKNFITKYGKTVNEISDLELEELTNQKYNANDCITDDCGVTYKNNPLVLLFKPYRRDIENYKIKEGTVAITNEAFYSNDIRISLKNILIPDSVIAIGESAFYRCRIGQLKLPASLRYIGRYAFRLSKIKPKSVIRISLCRTAKRNPLFFPIWTGMIFVFLMIWLNIKCACLLFSPDRQVSISTRTG